MTNRRLLTILACLIAATAACGLAQPITGRVVDEHGPVAGAHVRIKGTAHTTTTDPAGRFTLQGKGARITAWKEAHFIAGAPVGDEPLILRLHPLPSEDNVDYTWVDPHPDPKQAGNCANCHAEIFREWSGSAHGRATTNRRFLDLYAGREATGDRQQATEKHKEKWDWNLLKDHPEGAAVCSACHAPTVPFDDPGFGDFRKLSGVAARGVHCDFCHKIADAPTDRLGLDHGRFAYRLLRPKEGQLFFGPLDDVDRGEDAYSPLYKESRYCAACHEGTVFGTKVYTTYSEWLESPARKQGKQCQTCHMTPTGKMDNIAPGRGGIPRDPKTLASHAMPGATEEMLKRCLKVDVQVRRAGDANPPVLRVEVATTATDVGHRVPTGFIDRNLVLLVEAITNEGKAVPLTEGPKLPEVSGLGGQPGRYYGRHLVDTDDRTVPFWRPNREAADTRLVPDQADRAIWTFPGDGVKEIRVRLIYRRFLKDVAEAKGWRDNEVVVVDRRIDVP